MNISPITYNYINNKRNAQYGSSFGASFANAREARGVFIELLGELKGNAVMDGILARKPELDAVKIAGVEPEIEVLTPLTDWIRKKGTLILRVLADKTLDSKNWKNIKLKNTETIVQEFLTNVRDMSKTLEISSTGFDKEVADMRFDTLLSQSTPNAMLGLPVKLGFGIIN